MSTDRFREDLQRILPSLAERAVQYDRTGELPAENYRALAEIGFFRLALPVKDGGFGGGVEDIAQALRTLAGACASTALATCMHQTCLWTLLRNPGFDAGYVREVFAQIGRGEAILAGLTSEPQIGRRLGWTRTVARTVEGGGLQLDGLKIFATQSGLATHLMGTCSIGPKPHPSNPDFSIGNGMFLLPVPREGVVIGNDWDALGMRATGSGSVRLQAVRAEERWLLSFDRVNAPRRLYASLQLLQALELLCFGAVYLGILEQALRTFAELSRARAVPQLGKRHAQLERVRLGFGRVKVRAQVLGMLLERATRAVERLTALVDAFPDSPEARLPPSANDESNTAAITKLSITDEAPALIAQLMDLLGGSAYTRACPLERHYRDARAGSFMPIHGDELFEFAASQALGPA